MNNSFLRQILCLLWTIFFISSVLPNAADSDKSNKKRMKILMVVACFPKIHDICILNQITGLIDRGHDVHIFAFSRGDCVKVQVDVITYDLISKTIFNVLPANLDDYDIIMFQLGHKVIDVRRTHNFTGKIVICLRGYDITGYLHERPFAYHRYFDSCDLFMPVCEAFKKILEGIGCPSHKIVVVHSSIDCSKFIFKKRTLPRYGLINIVSSGRFIEKKGFAYSIRAVAELIKKYPQIRYTIIGGGELKNKYKALIKKLHVEGKIRLEGWHTHKEYIALLDQAHIFILPSITAHNNDQEGIPNVLKEAMAMGLVPIATHHSGNSELIQHGVSGFLVPEKNVSAIKKMIEYIITHQKLWPSIQSTAVKKIRDEFEREKENDRLEAILYKLLEQ